MTSLQKWAFFAVLALMSYSCSITNKTQTDQIQKVGSGGGLRLEPSSGDRNVPNPVYRNEAMLQRAAPTNQWYSSLMYQRWGEAIYATPLTAKPTPKGLEISYPSKEVIPTDRQDVEIHYVHGNDLLISPIDFKPHSALLGNYSDWAVDIEMVSSNHAMVATLSHGSPYIYLHNSQGGFKVAISEGFQSTVHAKHASILLVQNNQKQYALFAPKGANWQQQGSEWAVSVLDKAIISVAVLPDLDEKTVTTFYESAFVVVKDTIAKWKVNRDKMTVKTDFQWVTEEQMSNDRVMPIIGLYPHQYYQNNMPLSAEIGVLQSIRGPIRLFKTDEFSTELRHNGFVPIWPKVDAAAADDLRVQLRRDVSASRRMMLEIGTGPYWQGKGLQRISQLMQVAQAQGETQYQQKLLEKIKRRAEKWLSGHSNKTYFYYDKKTGTVVSYPEEYDAVQDMNDHHFHYGYWIRAAAEIAMADPQWADQWGEMIDWLVKDIATAERGQPAFPYLRNFDPYEGHSWASGVGRGPHGNNQESTSEAVNAWAALMMWGAVRGRSDLVDLGIYMYNTEIESARHYWFDVYGLTLADEYLNESASIVFGGKTVHNTWWIDEPRQIHGINL